VSDTIMTNLGKILVVFGVFLVVIGGILLLAGRHFPFLGKLPGDIHVKGERFEFYFPVTTCLIVSLLLTLVAVILFRVVR
jgi:hypothetical protein